VSQPATTSADANTQEGLIAFFDILGYKSIIQNNSLLETINVIKQIEGAIQQAAEKLKATEEFLQAPICRYVLFSDSILVYTVSSTPDLQTLPGVNWTHMIPAVSTEFSADLINRLLFIGLPVRGALAYGGFYVDDQSHGRIAFAGKPIIEAYEYSNSIDMSGCILAPSAETYLLSKNILDTVSQMYFTK
jgi:hypothetical protein